MIKMIRFILSRIMPQVRTYSQAVKLRKNKTGNITTALTAVSQDTELKYSY
jgi:hypothetical protein